ncbi:NADPH:adrenodoxin oxidoreductase [Carex littledalei]|uniref:NADPH:adrenodoxin oxidoreductase n=1 Tax=Carex littledalei TaxID=544730 RepID=A0A833R4N4_9POAL|nr:NADPH:adrenodoxin oxidoreductase [Carex littledalei]
MNAMRRFLLYGQKQRQYTRGFSSATRDPLHVCVVGSGPAGFYTADKMLKAHQGAQVDLIDRLPTPFGLVRSGVAPDHPETKIVVNQFSLVASHDRCSFFGNVSLGSSVSLSELRQTYDAVVLAYGSESDRSLGIPGEDLKGVYSAREFVWWYNGHPDYCEMAPEFCNGDTAVVLGQVPNKILTKYYHHLMWPECELETTDIADHALDSLRKSTIRNVYLVGRRGPVQAACTAKELREILGMKNLNVHINKTDLATSPLDEEEMKNNRICKRVYKLLTKAAKSPLGDSATDVRNLYFVFFRKPIKFISEDNSTVSSVHLEKTVLKENGSSGKQMAVGTGEIEETKCGLVLKSIGYKSLPIDGLPFDNDRGVVPNVKGRVLTSTDKMDTKTEQGLYVVGWLQRGPTGIVDLTMAFKPELRKGGNETSRNARISLARKFWTGEARLKRCLSRFLPPKNVEEYMTTDDPTIRNVLDENFDDIDPPPEWEVCPTCLVKGDIAEMFFCHLFGVVVHLKCIDKNADLINDYRFEMWECVVYVLLQAFTDDGRKLHYS